MRLTELEHLSWEAMRHVSRNRKKKYDQLDVARWLNINVAEAYEVTNFLVEMGVCKYK